MATISFDRGTEKRSKCASSASPAGIPSRACGARKDGEKGLLSKLQFWKSNDPMVKAEQFRVHIRQFAGKSVVQILTKDGAQANTQTTRRIVALLYEQLK